MSKVTLTGQLVCATEADAAIVREYLPAHIELTRAEVGCEKFEVTQGQDPQVWHVDERYADQAAFRAHQARTADSAWGRATMHIERRYTITGLE